MQSHTAASRKTLTPVSIAQVTIHDEFWSPKRNTWRTVTIHDALDKFEKTGVLENFDRIRDGRLDAHHDGPSFYDGLLYEMICGSADFLAAQRDAALESRLDGIIDHIVAAAAVAPDGYINTWTQLLEPEHRWGANGGNDHIGHDIYNAGCLVEAAAHYYRATGKPRLLQTAVTLANTMCEVMGPAPKMNQVPGHSLPEGAFIELYHLFREQPDLKREMPVAVNEADYLALAEFWIEHRGVYEGRTGKDRSFGRDAQDHKPVLQQETIEGHAVRAALLFSGVVATALVNGRKDYLDAAQRIWENMVHRRMYITGGIGAVSTYEGFANDYVLPNDGYLETCAAVGAGFFHANMHRAFGDARYMDELERALYNNILAGVSLAGNSYFYMNPLVSEEHRRWEWHGCPCCPPMFLKFMGALPGYIYSQDADGVYVNLFIGSEAKIHLNNQPITLTQRTHYPWDGQISIRVDVEESLPFTLRLRLPGWRQGYTLSVNGQEEEAPVERGYACITRKWESEDTVELNLAMPVERIEAHPAVSADVGRIAIQRGPLVYCVEGVDHTVPLSRLAISEDTEFTVRFEPELLGGVMALDANAQAISDGDWGDQLYRRAQAPALTPTPLRAIPYYACANREAGALAVWLRKR